MKAIVSITLDNEFVIHDIKVIEGEKGLFIAGCRAEKLLTANTAISPIRSIPEHGHDPESDPRQVETTTLEEAQAV